MSEPNLNEIAQLVNRLVNDLTMLRISFSNALDDIQRLIEDLTGTNIQTMQRTKKGLLMRLQELMDENKKLKEEIEKLKQEKK